MKPGTRLKSIVCETEVMVIRSGGGPVIECGGQPMTDDNAAERGKPDAAYLTGTLIGKRYADATGTVEVLCVKAGQGTLSLGGVALQIKNAKPLPSSD